MTTFYGTAVCGSIESWVSAQKKKSVTYKVIKVNYLGFR